MEWTVSTRCSASQRSRAVKDDAQTKLQQIRKETGEVVFREYLRTARLKKAKPGKRGVGTGTRPVVRLILRP